MKCLLLSRQPVWIWYSPL